MALNGGGGGRADLSLWNGVLGRAAGLGCGRAGCGSLLGLLGLFGGGGGSIFMCSGGLRLGVWGGLFWGGDMGWSNFILRFCVG